MKQSNTTVEPRVAVALFDLALWFLTHTNRFPKNWRKSLGDRIDGTMLDLVSLVQRASLQRDKRPLLERVNEELHVLRALVRMAVRLGCLQEHQYEYAARQIEDIGRQVGGWLKQQRERTQESVAVHDPAVIASLSEAISCAGR